MHRFVLLSCAALVIAGCGGSPQEEAADTMTEMVDVLKSIKDTDSAKAAVEELEELVAHLKSIHVELKLEDVKEIDEATQAKFMKALEAYSREWGRVLGDPEIRKVLAGIDYR